MGYTAKRRLNSTVIHLFLILGAIAMLIPFVWMVLTAFKTKSQAISVDPFYIFPAGVWHWENFSEVWNSYNFLTLYVNTLIVMVLRVVCAVLTATMAG
ncbi:MAG: carbohydrate ABC transporter permease, partial [Blautia sp.]|nr:carbohydrate ABC transporter permease [Blautia sp.]